MTGAWRRVSLAGLLAGALVAPAAAEEVSLEYVRYPAGEQEDEAFLPRSTLFVEDLATSVPRGDFKLPPLTSKQPLFALLELAGEQRLLVFDRAQAGDPFFSVLYCDAGGDGDLTNDPALKSADPEALPGFFEPPPLDLTLRAGSGRADYSLRVGLSSSALLEGGELSDPLDLADLSLHVTTNCCYAGDVAFGGGVCRLLLADANVNGRFDDVARCAVAEEEPVQVISATGDFLYLTTAGAVEASDFCSLGNVLALGKSLFQLRIDAAAKTLVLEPYAGATAALDLPQDCERLFLASEDGGTYAVMLQPSRAAVVPPGTYRVAGYRLLRADAEGDVWSVAAAATPRTPFFTATAGSSTTVVFGEPFAPAARVPRRAYEESAGSTPESVPVEFRVDGSAQEVVTDLRRVSGSATKIEMDAVKTHLPKAPAYVILSAAGKIAARGAFEYG
ncbi:MAG: hypothetical protein HY812_16260 [Planctomycetes bacterium]|nr:hypothetical protein [Planctomycetota bacterium]